VRTPYQILRDAFRATGLEYIVAQLREDDGKYWHTIAVVETKAVADRIARIASTDSERPDPVYVGYLERFGPMGGESCVTVSRWQGGDELPEED